MNQKEIDFDNDSVNSSESSIKSGYKASKMINNYKKKKSRASRGSNDRSNSRIRVSKDLSREIRRRRATEDNNEPEEEKTTQPPNSMNMRPSFKSKTSAVPINKKSQIMKKYPPPIDQLHTWLYERAAKEIAKAKKNDDKVRWLKFACLIESLSKNIS